MLLQLAFLALLVFALADPIFKWQQAQARRLVLVVDNSASMNAGDVLPSRLESAKSEARRLVDGMRLGDELAVIAAGPQPRVACGMTDHQRTLREAIDTIAPGDGPTRIDEAVALARRLLSGSEKTRKAIVLTDAGFEGAADLARQEDIELIELGARRRAMSASPGSRRGAAWSTRSVTRSWSRSPIHSKEPVSCRLELDLADDPIDVVPLTLNPGQPSVHMFEKTSAEGGRLRRGSTARMPSRPITPPGPYCRSGRGRKSR